ncbi:MAG: Mov34/MPN/PAD-1 family protein [Pirellulaceae bacterium]|nr:Mov34/MPN/PAD-1 family protein [Pirellulaceae bacterium]
MDENAEISFGTVQEKKIAQGRRPDQERGVAIACYHDTPKQSSTDKTQHTPENSFSGFPDKTEASRPASPLSSLTAQIEAQQDREEIPVFIDFDTMQELELHAQSNRSVELGGVLLGQRKRDENGNPFLLIEGSLRAKHYQATKGSFTFTHDTWQTITREKEHFAPNLEIVGWYHTHPGWGVFLSGMDRFICHNFFNNPLDLALVIDPCQHERGIFQWAPSFLEKQKEQSQNANQTTPLHRISQFYVSAQKQRKAELFAYIQQLETTSNMNRPHSTPIPAYAGAGNQLSGVLPILGIILACQFCMILAIFTQLFLNPTSDDPEIAALLERIETLEEGQGKDYEIQIKTKVLDDLLGQRDFSPEGVVTSLQNLQVENKKLSAALLGVENQRQLLAKDIQTLRNLVLTKDETIATLKTKNKTDTTTSKPTVTDKKPIETTSSKASGEEKPDSTILSFLFDSKFLIGSLLVLVCLGIAITFFLLTKPASER